MKLKNPKQAQKMMQELDPTFSAPYLVWKEQNVDPSNLKFREMTITDLNPWNLRKLVLKARPTCHETWRNRLCSADWETGFSALNVWVTEDSAVTVRFAGNAEQCFEEMRTVLVVAEKPKLVEALTFDTELGCYRTMMIEVE